MSMILRLVALVLPLLTGMIIDRVVPRSDYSLLYVVLAAIGGMGSKAKMRGAAQCCST